MKTKLIKNGVYLLLIDEEAVIKENDILYSTVHKYVYEVKSIERNRLIWHEESYKIIGYYPLTKEAKELDLPLLPEWKIFDGFKSLNEVIKEEQEYWYNKTGSLTSKEIVQRSASLGYKTASKQFSLEDISMFFVGEGKEGGLFDDFLDYRIDNKTQISFKDWFIQTKQSLSTQQLPKEFECHYDKYCSTGRKCDNKGNNCDEAILKIKTITNSEGRKILVGHYKY